MLPLVVVMGVCMVKQVGDDDGGDGGDDDGGGGGDDDDVGGDYEGGGDPVVVMLDVHCDFVVMFHFEYFIATYIRLADRIAMAMMVQ